MKEREVTPRAEYMLRLERGEDVLPAITDFCKRKGILSGSFRAIGAVEDARIGFYNLAEKKYGDITYSEAREVASMTGNIAQVDGAPFIHAHAVLTDMTKNESIGGHVFEAKVAVTLEVHLVAFNESISRELDADIGLKLLSL
jgi:uncharacterized protein